MPSDSAAACETSITRPSMNGPRSLTRTVTDLPVATSVTRTLRAERQRAMRRGQFAGIEFLAARGARAVLVEARHAMRRQLSDRDCRLAAWLLLARRHRSDLLRRRLLNNGTRCRPVGCCGGLRCRPRASPPSARRPTAVQRSGTSARERCDSTSKSMHVPRSPGGTARGNFGSMTDQIWRSPPSFTVHRVARGIFATQQRSAPLAAQLS